MMVRTFQQNSIPEPVPQAQVDPDRCKYIRQHPFTSRIDLNSFHEPAAANGRLFYCLRYLPSTFREVGKN